MSDEKIQERGDGSDTDINVLDHKDQTTRGGKSSEVGGYGVQSKAGVLHDPGGSATALAIKSGGAGVTNELPQTDPQHGGAEGGSVVTSGGLPSNASDHATKGGTNSESHEGAGVQNRSSQGTVKHNAPGSGAE